MITISRIIIATILSSMLFISCTDVIDVDVPESEARLVIEASIDWEKGTQGNQQTIKLSTSTPYFDTTVIDILTGASVIVTNDSNGTAVLFTDQNDGNYTTSSFVPLLNQSFTLEVIHNGETYIAHETLMPVADIESIFQSTENGFNDEALEVNIEFYDPADIENYYLIKFKVAGDLLPELYDFSDEFTDGNLMSIFYEREENEDINQKEFESGDVVDINLYGISEQYNSYMQLLISQYDSGGPFSATPVPLKGNCTNPSNQENYAFGYFRLTQVEETDYTFY